MKTANEIWEREEKPSALSPEERKQYVSLWERSLGCGLRLSPSEIARFRSLGARMGGKPYKAPATPRPFLAGAKFEGPRPAWRAK